MLLPYLLVGIVAFREERKFGDDVQFDHLRYLTSDSLKSEDDWFLFFEEVNCRRCYELKLIFTKVADKFEGKMKFGLVNCSKQQTFCLKMQMYDVPRLRYYKDGEFHAYEWSMTEEGLTA